MLSLKKKFEYRRSSRVSDKEQRDLAEKIRQENLQQEKAALEALKKQENTDQEEEGIKVHHLLITSCRRCMFSRVLFCSVLHLCKPQQRQRFKTLGLKDYSSLYW